MVRGNETSHHWSYGGIYRGSDRPKFDRKKKREEEEEEEKRDEIKKKEAKDNED